MSRTRQAILSTLVTVVTALVAYLGFVAVQSYELYHFVKSPRRGWSGQVHRGDAELGYAPRAGARGAHVFPTGPDLPMRYDREGFRVPVDADEGPRARPLVLALGCSLTYGDATAAEETYPYRVGQMLGGSAINAGVCSYGLAQMLLLARQLVEAHEPDYLLVQYSPWLVARALSPFAPSYLGKLATPYFADGDDGPALQPPVFPTALFDYPINDYGSGEARAIDFARFLGEVGLPLLVREHAGMIGYRAKLALGVVPEPSRDGSGVIQLVYGEIARIAADEDARMFAVLLDEPGEPAGTMNASFPVIDAQGALLARLDPPTRNAFLEQYAHWRGDPPRLVDTHPNARAHAVIAEAIVEGIRREASGAGEPES